LKATLRIAGGFFRALLFLYFTFQLVISSLLEKTRVIVRQRTILFDYFVSYALKSGIFCPNWGIFYGTLLEKKLGEF
jgi:hypothetical protein